MDCRLALQAGLVGPRTTCIAVQPPSVCVCRYVEPPAAVPLNNDLAAARGELYGAEEAVLWRLTGDVGDARYALQDTLDKVRGVIASQGDRFDL